jgi:ABC-type sugar transport system ATPase subunit
MLTRDARVLILDEPTATLSDVEIERIFAALRALRAEGKSIIYITHRLGEVFDICDTVSVLRNGELVGTRRTAEIDREHLMAMMLGRSMGEMYPTWQSRPGEPMLTVEHLRVPDIVHDFNLVAERGMVICIAGQVGSGAIEVLRALAGLAAEATGDVTVLGRKLALRSVPKAQAARVQFISEDRAGEGIFLRLSVGKNLVATRLADHSRFGLIAHRRLQAQALRLASAVGVDVARLRSRADELSGGNQQKLAFGRAIGQQQPGVLLMNEPTRGVDVGARAEIYRLIRDFCDRGYCLIMASSDIEEVLGMADIVVSMYRGRQVGQYRRGTASLQRVLADITHPVAA